MESTESRVLRSIQPYAQSSLMLDSRLADAGMGSLDVICAVHAIEEEFDCMVETTDFHRIQTVSDIVRLVARSTTSTA
jgi:acyl carrier protein